MPTPFARELACGIVKDHFGDQVETVCRTLLEKGQLGLSLQDLARHTSLPPPSLRSALLVLVQHNCAQAFRQQTDDTGPLVRTPTLYIALQDSILPRLRFPKFMDQTNELLGEEAEAVVEALLEHGRLSLHQLVQRAIAKAGSADPSAAKMGAQVRQQLLEALSVLVHERLVERVGSPEPMLQPRGAGTDAPKTASRARVRTRAMMEASGYFDSEEHRVVVAARCSDALRFQLPAAWVLSGGGDNAAGGAGGGGVGGMAVDGSAGADGGTTAAAAAAAAKFKRKRVVLDDEEEEGGGAPSAKRAATGAAGGAGGAEKQAGGNTEDSGVLWRVNYEEFLRRTRHQTIVDFVRESIDPGASIITAAMLHAGKNQETSLRHPYSASLSLDSIVNAVRGTIDGRTMALDRIRAALQLLVAHPAAVAARASDAHYTIQSARIIELVKLREVEAIVSQRFGPSACRLFRLLLSKHCLEQKQAAELSMISLADARQLLYRMMLDDFVQLQEVPKTADHAPQRTFYLWRIHIGTVLPRVLNHMCHAACNLRLRLAHEMQQEQEVLSLLEQIEQAHAAGGTGGGGAAGEGRAAPEKAVSLTSGRGSSWRG
ncbi:hypothetical protein CLOM_g23876 [Closterium sp. NIES-68]|nr:hypothetical protein CLOM_g23876 [Closterium sp. NIES-68]